MSDDAAPPDDPDRAAILARRQHFIALALSGLATACTSKGHPQPCLDIAPVDYPAETPKPPPDEPEPVEPPEVAPPEPCLKVMPSAEIPPDLPTSDTTGAATEEPPKPPSTQPRPCLRKSAPPRPCLKQAPPR